MNHRISTSMLVTAASWCLAFCLGTSSGSRAEAGGPWAAAQGEAVSLQARTEDVAERLNQRFPTSAATQVAMQLDNAACQLVEQVKCGGAPEHVYALSEQVCLLTHETCRLIQSDCHAKGDRTLESYVASLERRIERFETALRRIAPTAVYRSVAPMRVQSNPVPAAPSMQPNWSWRANPQLDPYPNALPLGNTGSYSSQVRGYREDREREYEVIVPNGGAMPIAPPAGPAYGAGYPSPVSPYGPAPRPIGRQILSGVLHELANRL